MSNLRNDDSPPPLWGLVLAGGESRRMGRDKGNLALLGEPQATVAWQMLDRACSRAFVSVRPGQTQTRPYSKLPQIVDDGRDATGPVAGLLAAWKRYEDVAWLLLAADMPFVDEAMLQVLIENRDATALATAFRRREGKPEPLCTIWEPGARVVLRRRASTGERSLGGLLEVSPVRWIEPGDAATLASVNTPEELERARAALSGSRAVQSGDRDVQPGDRTAESGDRDTHPGDCDAESGDRAAELGDRTLPYRGAAANRRV